MRHVLTQICGTIVIHALAPRPHLLRLWLHPIAGSRAAGDATNVVRTVEDTEGDETDQSR